MAKTGEDIHPDSQSMALGGCAFNVAYAMELLKAPYTLISPVGGGTYGDYAAKQLTSLGIPPANPGAGSRKRLLLLPGGSQRGAHLPLPPRGGIYLSKIMDGTLPVRKLPFCLCMRAGD